MWQWLSARCGICGAWGASEWGWSCSLLSGQSEEQPDTQLWGARPTYTLPAADLSPSTSSPPATGSPSIPGFSILTRINEKMSAFNSHLTKSSPQHKEMIIFIDIFNLQSPGSCCYIMLFFHLFPNKKHEIHPSCNLLQPPINPGNTYSHSWLHLNSSVSYKPCLFHVVISNFHVEPNCKLQRNVCWCWFWCTRVNKEKWRHRHNHIPLIIIPTTHRSVPFLFYRIFFVLHNT